LKTHLVAFDLCISPTGWQLYLYGRSRKAQAFLVKLMTQPPLRKLTTNAQPAGDRHIVQLWPLAADPSEILEALRCWISAVVAAGKSS
jgi:hypothetical protein